MSLLGRSFLKELDFTPDEWRGLLDLAAELKLQRREGREERDGGGCGLAEHADASGRWRRGREGRVDGHVGGGPQEAVGAGPDDAHAGRAGGAQEGALPLETVGPDLGEALRVEQQGVGS